MLVYILHGGRRRKAKYFNNVLGRTRLGMPFYNVVYLGQRAETKEQISNRFRFGSYLSASRRQAFKASVKGFAELSTHHGRFPHVCDILSIQE